MDHACTILAAEHRPMLLAYARALCYGDGHAAEDVVQETLLVACRRLDEFRAETDGHFGRWLRGIARNKALEAHRAAGRGRVVGEAARFYVGCHAEGAVRTDRGDRDGKNPGSGKGRPMKTTTLTRVLVLAGVATLANVHGEATGRADDLLVATADAAPERHAVAANADFAMDLYAQLAKDNAGKNLFFSPYSMASALAMTAEGARGETAAEMGKVLRYPEAARRIGDDAQPLPWNTSLIHSGMAARNERFQSKADTPYEISVANALYGEKTFPFSPDYVATIGKFYGTGAVVPVDFINAPEPARLRINAWAEEKPAAGSRTWWRRGK